MHLLIGIILLISPVLLLNKFQDKKLGLAYTLVFIICTQFIIAIFTQSLGIFTYSTILISNIIISGIIFLKVFRKTNLHNLLREFIPTIKKLDMVAVFVLITAFTSLSFVHYNYSGKYITVNNYLLEAKSMSYPYPYYSDEWYAVAFIQETIDSHYLPIINPLVPQKTNIINLELPFHSLLSEITLLLRLTPLNDYNLIAMFVNSTIILLVYFLLRSNRVNKLPAGIASLSSLYLTNGATLPGIWYLLPINIGLVCLLLGFIFISLKKTIASIFMAFITLLFYPPLFVFYTPALLLHFLLSKDINLKKKILAFFSFAFIVFIAGSIISLVYFLSKGEFSKFFNYIFLSKIIHPVFTPNSLPNYSIFSIVPVPILFLAIIGTILLLRKKLWLIGPLIIGLLYWLVYSYATFRFIIEYERAVFVTSILLVIVAGFGLNYLVDLLKFIFSLQKSNIFSYVQLLVILMFLILAPNYTKRDNWERLTLYNYKTGQTFLPEPPANKHLQPDDLKLFSDIKYKRFLSLPWKGTVIGVATKNYPVVTRPGTISNAWVSLEGFLQADCSTKDKYSQNYLIEYFFLPEFNCPNFEVKGKSSEGLFLYKSSLIK